MQLLLESHDPGEISDRMREAQTTTAELIRKVISETCRRFRSAAQTEKTLRIDRLIGTSAWTDAALALIELELPQWQVRRIAYDDGEWYCALSRERELPEWLDQSIEGRHTELPLALLCALVDAQRVAAPPNKSSVPAVPCQASTLYEPAICDNFA